MTALTVASHSAAPRAPLFGGDRGLIAAILVLGAVIAAWKAGIAMTGNVIWEEAHFVMLGQHPDFGYADVPAGWPLLARIVTAVFGPSPTALRLVTLALAQAIPFAIYFLARAVVPRREALWAALISLIFLPLTASGTIYYPEGALQLLLALMLGSLIRAVRQDRMGWWIATGACAALGLVIHYRFVLAGAGVLAFALLSRDGRRMWLRPGFWLAGLIALAGLLPGLIYNIREGWPVWAYQVSNRPGGTGGPQFKYASALIQAQIAAASPVFFVGLVAAVLDAVRRARRGETAAGLLFWAGAAVFGVYLAAAPFSKQMMPHWPFLAYVAWIPFLPGVLIRFVDRAKGPVRRGLRQALVALGPLFTLAAALAVTVFEVAWANPALLPPAHRGALFMELEDWRLVQPALLRGQAAARKAFGGEPVLAASGHIPALRLEFPGPPGRRLYALGDPYDQFTRFTVQRRQWALDAQALRRDHAGQGVVIVLPEPSYLYHTPPEADFRKGLCAAFDDIAPVETVELPPGRVAVEVYVARVRAHPQAAQGRCALFPRLYIAQPTRGANLKAGKAYQGFGVAADPAGVARVEVLLDGQAAAEARYGLDPPGGRVSDALAFDPAYPKVQFDYVLPAERMTRGAHRLSLRATRSDGSVLQGAPRTIYVP
jgi:hypothetical protein